MTGAPLLVARHLTKRFGTHTVLDALNFVLQAGSVHVLMGENGAGKSTFIKIIGGLLRPDDGELRMRDEIVEFRTVAAASGRGIRVVHQEINLAPTLTVAETIFLGAMPRKPRLRWQIDRAAMCQGARSILFRLGVSLDADTLIEDLTIAQRQLVEIARALAGRAEIIILDEPTASLNAAEVDALLGTLRTLKSQGLGLIYISHRMEEARRIGDWVSVLRDGRLALSSALDRVSDEALVTAMIGRPLRGDAGLGSTRAGEPALRVTGLSGAGLFEDVSLEVRAGEILGVVGPLGAGFAELGHVIYGVRKKTTGKITVFGRTLKPGPRRSMQAGLAFVTEDRKRSGLMLKTSVRRNTSAAILHELTPRFYLTPRDEHRAVQQVLTSLEVSMPGPSVAVRLLSGGNQQKIVLGRWLLREPRILILAEPTRGVDVGAKETIYRQLQKMTADGGAVLLLTSDLMEAARLCDRVMVMRRGRVFDEVHKRDLSVSALVGALYAQETPPLAH